MGQSLTSYISIGTSRHQFKVLSQFTVLMICAYLSIQVIKFMEGTDNRYCLAEELYLFLALGAVALIEFGSRFLSSRKPGLNPAKESIETVGEGHWRKSKPWEGHLRKSKHR